MISVLIVIVISISIGIGIEVIVAVAEAVNEGTVDTLEVHQIRSYQIISDRYVALVYIQGKTVKLQLAQQVIHISIGHCERP